MATGHIRHLELYQQGKMLDHSAWKGKLKRGITPSDVDMMFDFNGTILLVELKLNSASWFALPKGQRIAYTNLVKAGKGKIIVACAQIAPTDDKPLNTLTDIVAFQVMTNTELSQILPGEVWEKFVLAVQEKAH